MKPPKTKICTKCGKRKKLGEFVAHKDCIGGVGGACKKCEVSYQKAYYQSNREKCKAYSKAYYQSNSEKCKAYQKEYQKAYYQSHKEQSRKQGRKWYSAYREKVHLIQKKYRDCNQDKIKESHHKHQKKSAKNMSDTYMRRMLVQETNLNYKDITSEMIQIKREYLTIYRMLRKKESA